MTEEYIVYNYAPMADRSVNPRLNDYVEMIYYHMPNTSTTDANYYVRYCSLKKGSILYKSPDKKICIQLKNLSFRALAVAMCELIVEPNAMHVCYVSLLSYPRQIMSFVDNFSEDLHLLEMAQSCQYHGNQFKEGEYQAFKASAESTSNVCNALIKVITFATGDPCRTFAEKKVGNTRSFNR